MALTHRRRGTMPGVRPTCVRRRIPPPRLPYGPRERVPSWGADPAYKERYAPDSREWALRGCRAERPPLPPRGNPKEATCFLS